MLPPPLLQMRKKEDKTKHPIATVQWSKHLQNLFDISQNLFFSWWSVKTHAPPLEGSASLASPMVLLR